MDIAEAFFFWVGVAEFVVLAIGVIYGLFLWGSGIAPVLYRLGNGLAHRKIAIFASGDNLTSLRQLLVESKLFKEKNLLIVPSIREIDDSHGASVFLMYWPDWSEHLDEIMRRKGPKCALVVYQPYDQGRIPDAQMAQLDGRRHSAVTNFRGRLLNDLVTSIMTTSYAKE